jgi:photosystem II stability/assembly factor-like uncharacterized protein
MVKLGFNTSGNSQTSGRTTAAVNLGKLRNTPGSASYKFKYCNNRSPDLNFTFNCVFNRPTNLPNPLDESNGNIQTIVTENGIVYLSQNYGKTWKKNDQLSKSGYSLYGNAMSLNGVYQITSDTIKNAKIFISNNYGNLWSNQTSGLPNNFYFETGENCMSGSGQYQYVIDESSASTNNKIYVSSDYGNSWAEPGSPPLDFGNPLSISSITCSTSGQKCAAIGISQVNPKLTGYVYLNSDYGQTWGDNQAYQDNYLVCCGISGDGNYVSIGYYNTSLGSIKINTAIYGLSFVSGNITQGPNGDWGIYTISLSYTGKYQIASNAAASGAGSGSNGYIYITTDYGVNWHYINTIYGAPTVNMQWNNVAISPSGKTMVAVGYYGNFSNGTNWYVYSNDYGNTWKSKYFGINDVITSIAIN